MLRHNVLHIEIRCVEYEDEVSVSSYARKSYPRGGQPDAYGVYERLRTGTLVHIQDWIAHPAALKDAMWNAKNFNVPLVDLTQDAP